MTTHNERKSAVDIDEQFLNRWSPRAFLDEPVSDQEIRQVMEAARWAPSCYNEQPWVFYTSTSASYPQFLSLLVEANQDWAKSAPVLGFVVASKQLARNGKDNPLAKFDSGAAWMAMSLQAQALGLLTHGMAGFNYAGVYEALNIDPETHEVIAAFALGRADLSADESRSDRKPVEDIWKPIG